jgi:hypothetical protein
MKVISAYDLEISTHQIIELPTGATLLGVTSVNDRLLLLHAIVDPDVTCERRLFRIVGNGDAMYDDGRGSTYVGTAQSKDGSDWHVFDYADPAIKAMDDKRRDALMDLSHKSSTAANSLINQLGRSLAMVGYRSAIGEALKAIERIYNQALQRPGSKRQRLIRKKATVEARRLCAGCRMSDGSPMPPPGWAAETENKEPEDV